MLTVIASLDEKKRREYLNQLRKLMLGMPATKSRGTRTMRTVSPSLTTFVSIDRASSVSANLSC